MKEEYAIAWILAFITWGFVLYFLSIQIDSIF